MQTIRIPATSANLGPGFDCLGMALCCYNTIAFEFTEDGFLVELVPGDEAVIPRDKRNLIYRVFINTLQKLGASVPGLHIVQGNGIPTMRGLGSSAACVAGGVLLADAYTGNKLSLQEKIELCAAEEGHPDNALPAMTGGIAIGGMDGSTVRYMRFDPPSGMRLVVFIPPFSLSTKKARAVLPQQVSRSDAVFNLSRAALVTAAFAAGDLSLLPFAMQDRLHQPYRIPLVNGYREIESIARKHGALCAYLSGAGPTIIAIWDGNLQEQEALYQEAAALGWRATEMQVDRIGCTIE